MTEREFQAGRTSLARLTTLAGGLLALLVASIGAQAPDPLGDSVVLPGDVKQPARYVTNAVSGGGDGLGLPVGLDSSSPEQLIKPMQLVNTPGSILRDSLLYDIFSWEGTAAEVDYYDQRFDTPPLVQTPLLSFDNKTTPADEQGDLEASWIFAPLGNLQANTIINDYPDLVDLPAEYTAPDYSEQDVLNFYTNPTGNPFLTASYLSQHGAVSEDVEDWLAELLPWSRLSESRLRNVSEWHYRGDMSGVEYREIPENSGVYFAWLIDRDATGDDLVYLNKSIGTIKQMILEHGPVTCAMSLDRASAWRLGADGYAPLWFDTGENFSVPYQLTRANPEDLDHWVQIIGWDDSKKHWTREKASGETDIYYGAWRVLYSRQDSCDEDRGVAWVGYGAAGIGAHLSYFNINGTQDYDPDEVQLAADTGWDGG
ncbi:hypothetical protein HQ520_04630, partial [bacterium]|nr:hypothetical protein [bacterium]